MPLGASVAGLGPNLRLLSATVSITEIAKSKPAYAKQKPLATGGY